MPEHAPDVSRYFQFRGLRRVTSLLHVGMFSDLPWVNAHHRVAFNDSRVSITVLSRCGVQSSPAKKYAHHIFCRYLVSHFTVGII